MTVIKNIQEIIPLTIQGEGFHAGRSCSFIRLFGCPVGCWFCDTGYAPRDREDLNKLTRESIDYESLREQLQSRYVVISGGEPLYHQDFEELLERLVGDDFEVAVETSGAKAFPFEKFPQVWVTFSPKLHATEYLKDLLSPTFWSHSQEIKVVISRANDLEAYEQLLDQAAQHGIPIYLQPEWSKKGEATPLILKVLRHKPDWKISVQIHKYLQLP
ncbi:MAG: radical SAM protein [Deltaproteobacteria bacterium]|nr:radical SAM protein [Deltaproteobacteria bacterium]MBT7205281.1 radical SAM protein [Deltaproteobacteria bacterium]